MMVSIFTKFIATRLFSIPFTVLSFPGFQNAIWSNPADLSFGDDSGDVDRNIYRFLEKFHTSIQSQLKAPPV